MRGKYSTSNSTKDPRVFHTPSVYGTSAESLLILFGTKLAHIVSNLKEHVHEHCIVLSLVAVSVFVGWVMIVLW